MSEKSWSSLTDSAGPHGAANAGIYRGIDSGTIEPFASSPAEFVEIARERQNEIQRPVTEVISSLTTAFSDAEQEQESPATAPEEFNWTVVSASEAGDLRKVWAPYTARDDPETDLKSRYTAQGASSSGYAMELWENISDKPLANKDVILFDISDVLSEERRPVNSAISALPIINGDVSKTLEVVGAVRGALSQLNELAEHGSVQKVLTSIDEMEKAPEVIRMKDGGNGPTHSAYLRMFAEGTITSAQVLALSVADAEPNVDLDMAACTLARANFFEKTALGLPPGIVGPLALHGIVPKGGLIKNEDGVYSLDKNFTAALKQETRSKQKNTDFVTGVEATLDDAYSRIFKLPLEERDEALEKLRFSTLAGIRASRIRHSERYEQYGYLAGNGCPAVFYDKASGGGPIKLTTAWLLRPFMPKRTGETPR